jgi:amino acid adenylation domain-containing protein
MPAGGGGGERTLWDILPLVAEPACPLPFHRLSIRPRYRSESSLIAQNLDTSGASLVARLRERAESEPNRIAMRFLAEHEGDETHLDYGSLDRRARALAVLLSARGAGGKCVLVAHAPGLDYVVALFGCLYAGAVAVPAYPPRAGRPLGRLRGMVLDSKAEFALTTPPIFERIQRRLVDEPALSGLSWIVSEPSEEGAASRWRDPERAIDSLALLQYTSGSTSEPKGVMLTEGHFVRNVHALVAQGGLDADDRVVSWLPPYHDMGLLSAIMLPVITGTEAILLSPSAFVQQPARWLRAITRFRGTISGGPNFAYDSCIRRVTAEERAALDLSSWRIAFSGAERVQADTVERFCELFAASGFRAKAFTPCYGLAEATLGVSFADSQRGAVIREFDASLLGEGLARPTSSGRTRRLVSSGKALPGCRVQIVDPQTSHTEPDGKVGEIWVSGNGVATGYYGQEALSRSLFHAQMADADTDSSEGFLRTGDLGFLLEGELFVTGRIKELVIVRGVNHFPEDLEGTALSSHLELRPAGGAAFCVDIEDEERLVIVHEVRTARELHGEEVAAAIRRAVADEHELPVHEVVLVAPATLPKTSSGKLQRRLIASHYLAGSLAALARSPSQAGSSIDAAPPELVAKVARLMAEVLGVESVASDDDFFQRGGHSLMATQLASRAREALGVDLPLSSIFEATTPLSLAAKVAQLPTLAPLPPVQLLDRGEPLPLSFAQERMWFLHQIEPGGSAYNVAGAVMLSGHLDVDVLLGAFQEVLRRHEVLRTNYASVGGAPELRVSATRTLAFERTDLSGHPNPEAEATRLASELAHRPFDIGRDLLMRGGLYRLEPARHVLCTSMHHLITDAWSMGVLTREVLESYVELCAGRPPPVYDDRIQYADYAGWQRQQFATGRLDRELAYWKTELAGVPALELPFDLPPPKEPSSRGALLPVALPPDLLESLRGLGRRQGSTLFMVMLTALQVVLHRYSGQTDIVLGVPIANRNQHTSERFMGTLVNTLALRVQLEPELTFAELLQKTRASALGAYAHQDLPFERLVAELSLSRTSGRSPLIQAMFDFQNAPLPSAGGAGFQIEPFVLSRGASQFDLSVLVLDTELGQSLGFEYSTDRFSAERIEQLAAHYLVVLTEVLADADQPISRIALLSPPERRKLLELASRTCVGQPVTLPVHRLVEEQARLRPTSRAVVDDAGWLSYAELDERASALAEELLARGVGAGDRVAVYLDRTRLIPVALLAVLKTGAAYVPLDPRYPAARVEQVVADAEPKLVLTRASLETALPASLNARLVRCDQVGPRPQAEPSAVEALPAMAAYVIYTSGSTGRPKGVEVSHGALSNFLWSMTREPGLRDSDVLLSVTTVAFDISGLELFLPLINGACVHVVPSDVASDGARLRQLLETSDATFLQATPATWKLLIEAGFSGKPGLKALCGGEALPRDLADQLLCRADSVWNMYGPTETTIWSTVHRVGEGKTAVPLGAAISHTRLYVLDVHQNLTPLGAVGELYIGGVGVANGYLNRPDLTAERFFADPFAGSPGARMYRTGDLAKLQSEGVLEYLGRADYQIKLRGFRIEPGEIEAVLKQQAGVRDAVVVAREDRPGDVRLVAYYVPETAQVVAAELRLALEQRLPEYMVPAALVPLEAFPVTPNGKLDRKSLPAPAESDLARREDFVEPRDELETQLTALWQLVLGSSRLSVRDNFFSVGGHSLLAVRLMAKMSSELGIELPVTSLMQAPTVESLAKHIRELRATEPSSSRGAQLSAPTPRLSFVVPLQESPGKAALFCVHGAGGDVISLRNVGLGIGDDFSFYGIQSRGVDGTSSPFESIEEMASAYLKEVRVVQPSGPYYLCGFCGGGLVAFEMAHQLRARGESVRLLALLGSRRPGSAVPRSRMAAWRGGMARRGFAYVLARAKAFATRELQFLSARLRIFASRAFGRPVPHEVRNMWLTWAFFRAEARYRPPVYPGPLTLLRPDEEPVSERSGGPELGWRGFAEGGVEVQEVPGNHESLLQQPNAVVVARKLKELTLKASGRSRR